MLNIPQHRVQNLHGPAKILAWALLFWIASAPICYAAGNQAVHAADDLTIRFDSRWQGGGFGGYYPIRVEVRNAGSTRTVQFEFRPTSGDGPQVTRTVTAEQAVPLKFSLLIPLVGDVTRGQITVRLQSNGQKLMETSVFLPDRNNGTKLRPSLLIISDDVVDPRNFQTATEPTGTSYGSGGHMNAVQHIEPNGLPQSWLGYSTLDLVAIPFKTLQKLEAAERDAMLAWVHTGGTLIVYDVGTSSGSMNELEQLIRFDQHAMQEPTWRTLRPLTTPDQGDAAQLNGQAGFKPTQVHGDPVADAMILRRGLMQGWVFAWRGQPFPGSVQQWTQLLADLATEEWSWPGRYGTSPRFPNQEFLNFLIPGLQRVPVYAYLTFITAFTILIGPVNYVWFRRRRQLHFLLLTIPGLALMSSLTLLAYSVLSHGFGIQSRIRSLTVLDQGTNTAISTARIALHTGITPFQGLEFTRDVAVYPLWPESQRFQSGRMDWTNSQACRSGWLQARTQTQFVNIRHHRQRGHLKIEQDNDASCTVANGLSWNLESLAVVAPDGLLYVGGALKAGDTAVLLPAKNQSEAVANLRSLLERYPTQFPPNVSGAHTRSRHSYPYAYGYNSGAYQTSLTAGLMERQLQQVSSEILNGNLAGPRSYVAVCQQNPDVSPGIDGVDEKTSLHVLVGHY